MKRLLPLILVFCWVPAIGQTAPEVNLRRTVVVDVVARTKDAVVNISAAKIIYQRVSPFGNADPFQGMGPSEVVRRAANMLGSGFIIHPDGYVVTNNHVVDRAREITVELADGRKLKADLISADPEADLAILKISDPKPLPVLELGDSSDLMIGEPTIAVGNPLGYSHTVSTGIVSALHRDIDEGNKVTLADLIQTDAAINPGNSGGPLLNAYGQVIGINTAVRSDAQNIGFAIQVNRLRDLIPELMNPSQATKVAVPVKLMERRTLTPPAHVGCEIVSQDDPKKVLDAINGVRPTDIVDAYAMLLDLQAGDSLKVTWTDGTVDKTTVQAMPTPPTPEAIVLAKQRLGIAVEPLTPTVAQKFGIPVDDGALVTDVDTDSPAANAGIAPGDLIVQLGRYRVETWANFSFLMHHLPENGRVIVGFRRGDQGGYGVLNLGTANDNP